MIKQYKSNVILIFFISILLFSNSVYAKISQIKCILPSGNQQVLNIYTYQLTEYVSLSQLSKSIFPGSTYNPTKHSISLKNATLICKPNSPIITLQLQDALLTSTLKNPASILYSELHVPFAQFASALTKLGLLGWNQVSSDVYRFYNFNDPSFSSTYDLPKMKVYEEEIVEPSEPYQPESRINKKESTTYNKSNIPEVIEYDKSSLSTIVARPESQNDNVDLFKSELNTYPDNQHDQDELLISSSSVDNNKRKTSPTSYLQHLTTTAGIANTELCTITNIEIDKATNQIVITFTSNGESGKYQKPEFNGKEVILRLPDTENAIHSFSPLADGDPVLSFKSEKIRSFLLYKIRLHSLISNASIKKTGKNTLALTISYTEKQMPVKVTTADKVKWDLDVIVLDPGHGGEDAGAISINGYKEKDIALSIAKRVKELLKISMPETKVLMTRSDDTFIELYKRGQIANQYKGKLFVSIHCNSMPTKPHPAQGCESYILRPGRNTEAVRVAEKENASIKLEKTSTYNDVSEENLIVATMAQSAFVKFSEKYAAMLQKEVTKNTGLYNRGVNQAGFLVLVGASMPNVLFETGFLSNVQDEKLLSSESGQQKMAEGIARAIKRYAEEYIRKN